MQTPTDNWLIFSSATVRSFSHHSGCHVKIIRWKFIYAIQYWCGVQNDVGGKLIQIILS
jgi:hypothetical protein